MSKQNKQKLDPIEYRNYDLPENFPALVLTGERWRISDKPSHRLHFHNCLEIGICETDSAFMRFGRQMEECHAGDVTIVGRNVAHTTWSTEGCASKWSYIYVDLDPLMRSFFPMNIIADECTLRSVFEDDYTIIPRESCGKFYDLAMMIVRELDSKSENYQYSVRGLLLSLIVNAVSLSKATHKEENEQMTSPDQTTSIMPALQYLRAHFREEFPMDDLARICLMSSTHFRRTFTSVMGRSPHTYLTELRIREAAELLCATDRSILDISEEVGFQSVSSFNRHFMNLYQMTPRDYRKERSYLNNKSAISYSGWLLPEA